MFDDVLARASQPSQSFPKGKKKQVAHMHPLGVIKPSH
jgi:hypothetical protein